MGKITLLILFILSGCATQKEDDDYGLTVKQRDKLFLEQNSLEQLVKTKDQMFLAYKPAGCIKDWSKQVEAIKQKLKKTVNKKVRQNLWFDLGNCYILVGEYKLALYYYDLVMGLNLNNKRINSSIYFNLAQIYEDAGRDFLAYSYYKLANDNGDKKHFSLFKLGVLEFKQAEYTLSNQYFTKLQRYYPKSQILNFLIGVNYFHLGKKPNVINKVLFKLDEKSINRILLSMAIDFSEEKNVKAIEADLKSLDVDLSIHKQFKSYLLSQLER